MLLAGLLKELSISAFIVHLTPVSGFICTTYWRRRATERVEGKEVSRRTLKDGQSEEAAGAATRCASPTRLSQRDSCGSAAGRVANSSPRCVGGDEYKGGAAVRLRAA